MKENQVNIKSVTEMLNNFFGPEIVHKYFYDVSKFHSIRKPLDNITILHRNGKLNSEDTQKVKQAFQEYFSFFDAQLTQQARKRYLILSLVFFTLLLFSGVGCAYLPIIFLPLAFVFSTCLLVNFCIKSIQSTRSHADKLLIVNNLNQLITSLVDQHQTKTSDTNAVKKKKTVSFAPEPTVYEFFGENSGVRLRANSYDNGQCYSLRK